MKVEALGHRPPHLKFNCKFNFIECYWDRAERAGEDCRYNFEALKATVPEALASVNSASICGLYRLALRAIDAYSARGQCGAEEFKQDVCIASSSRSKHSA